jgi:hypothetical protein
MRDRTILAASLALLAAACSSTSSGSDPFVGTWSCSDTSATTFTQPPNTPATNGSSTATVTITDDGKGNLTIVRNSSDGTPTCTLKSTLDSDGRSTTLTAGQTCTTANGGTVTYTSGGGTYNSDGTRTTQSAWTYNGTTSSGAAIVGTGSGTGTCHKQ